MKFCRNCAKPIDSKRSNVLYCSNGCKSVAYRKRKGLDEPDFLKTKRTGHERSRALLTPEEEQRIKILDLEISNYKEPLQKAEKIYQEFHSAKVQYELTGKHFIKDEDGDLEEFKFKASTAPRPPYNYTPTKPRQGSANYEQRLKEYEQTLSDNEKNREEYNKNILLWNENKYKAHIEEVIYQPFQTAEANLQRIAKEIIDRKNQIEAIVGIATERTAESRRRENEKGRFRGSDLLKMKFTTLPFEGKWKELIGTPSKAFYGLIWGDAKAGKSYFSLEFAQYLTNFGKTLYIPIEEGISHTLKKKVQDVKATDVEMFATRDFNDIGENIEDAEFVFIDSATVIGVPPESVEALRAKFPEVAFIVLLQSTKAGANFKGNQSWKHNADFILELERISENSTRVTCTGRFGNGKLEYEY